METRDERTLSLLHLRKTFSEYLKIPVSGSRSNDPSRLLPLFHKVMSMYTPQQLNAEFKEVVHFATFLCSVLVKEVRQRAASTGTIEAAQSIAEFLRPGTELKGYTILEAIRFLLSSEDEIMIDAACKVSLPSTLVKTIYLFFDLPAAATTVTVTDLTENATETEDEMLKNNEKLHDMIGQIMEGLCRFKCVSEELVRKDDLLLLFVGTTSQVAEANNCWRKLCARLLEVIADKSITNAVIKYVIVKKCVRIFVKNLSSAPSNSHSDAQKTAESIICLSCFLKNSAYLTDQLLDEFYEADGYTVIKDFLLKSETDNEIVRNILLMAISLVNSGKFEITPQYTSGLVQLPAFQLPIPAGNGLSVRNLNAFALLYHVFLESTSESTSCTVIDILHSIYTCDPANYFILDKEYPLSIFIDQLERKPHAVRVKLLELIEFAVFQLSHIPCRELISLCVLLKTEISAGKTAMCTIIVQMCFKLITVDAIIKDAFREVGLLDALCFIIRRMFEMYEKNIQNASFTVTSTSSRSQDQLKLSLLTTDLLTIIIKNNTENGKLFTECFGAKLLIEIVCEVNEEWRSSLLQLVKQLLIVAPTDQYIMHLVNTLQDRIPIENLEVMFSLLKALLGVVRESHKVRIQFRKSGGFLALSALLLGLEKRFTDLHPAGDGRIPREQCQMLEFVHIIFKVFTLSMRFEPSNAKYFSTEITWDSITSLLRLTSIFNESTVISIEETEWKSLTHTDLASEIAACHEVFRLDDNIEAGNVPKGMPFNIYFGCYVCRLIFNMALDNYEKMTSDIRWNDDGASLEESIVSWTSSLLVHPGAIISMLCLLPSISASSMKWTIAAQYYVSLLLKAILKSERNQQIMCQVDMPKHLLRIAEKLFLTENHILLQPFYYLLERLSYQSLTPNQLRSFLRLDSPLCCRSLDDDEDDDDDSKIEIADNEGGPVPLQRVKALVSMMTPRDQYIGTAPSFVEFDMSVEGFAALYLPSLAPMFSTTKAERIFPPLNGFSFCTWIYLDALSDKKADAHPIRLLTVTRAVAPPNSDPPSKKPSQTAHLACFQCQFSAFDRSLLISTEESDQPGADLEKTANFQTDKLIRITLADQVRCGEWFHLAVVFNRSVLKSSQVSLYLNGRHISTQKLMYVAQNAGGAATQLAQTYSVNAVVGTLPALRRPSRLRFRLASIFLAEEPMTAETVRAVVQLQPHYIGNYQTASTAPLFHEEKIVFSLSAAATQELTLAKIRTMYGKMDAEILSQHLGISPNDHSTPLRVLCNTISHAPGAGRTFGGVIVGYLGMRTFTPRPVPSLLDSIGGFASVYGLIAMAVDSEGLYASLKSLVSAIRSQPRLLATWNNNRSYQILAVLLEDKAKMLNSHIMHMVFNVTGTADTSREHAPTISNPSAFEDLLCDLKVWKGAPSELHKMLLEHFYELITDHQLNNLQVVRKSSLLSRILLIIHDEPTMIKNTDEIIFNLISAIMQPQCDSRSILKIGQSIAATLPTSESECYEDSHLPFHISEIQKLFIESSDPPPEALHQVYIRNRLLNIIANFLANSNTQVQQQMCDQLVRTLGFDWLFALMSPGVHSGTIYLALRILLLILNQPSLLARFKEGSANGGWLSEADSVVRNRAAVVLGFSVSAHGGAVGSKIDINPELSNCGGFAALEHLMAAHADKPYPYYAMLSLLVGQPISALRFCDQFNMELVWTHVFGLNSTSSVFEAINSANFCFDAIIPLFAMIRTSIYHQSSIHQPWTVTNPSTVVQMITFMYQNSPAFFNIAHTDEFILALFSTLIEDTNAMGVKSEVANRRSQDGGGSPDAEYFQAFLAQPNVRIVMDLLKKICCDNLQVNTSKNDTIIDAILDNISESGNTRKTQIACLTSLLHSVLEHTVGTDLLSSSALPPNTQAQNIVQIVANISLLSSRAVDAFWNGLVFGSESMRMLSTLYHLQVIASKKVNKAVNAEPITGCIMRMTLFILSRPIDSVPVQLSVLDALSTLVSKRYLFLSSNEAWFFASLTHLIFMLSVTPDVLFQDNSSSSDLDRTSAQVAMCACRVWSDVICAKQALIEETFKKQSVTDINAARALLSHSAGVYWQQFVDSQLRAIQTGGSSAQGSAVTAKDIIQQQISSKFNRVASGITRFAAKRSMSTTTALPSSGSVAAWKSTSTDKQVIFMWLRVHVSLIKELVRAQSTRYTEWHAHVRKWCLHDWHQWEAELTRERGIWGPERASKLEKFKLDLTEGPTTRMRRKLIPNRNFYHIYPFRPHLEAPSAKAQRAKVAISFDSKPYYETCLRHRRRTLDTRIIDSSNVSTASPEDGSGSSNLLGYSFTDLSLSEINSSLIRRLSTTAPATSNVSGTSLELNEEECETSERKEDDESISSISEKTDSNGVQSSGPSTSSNTTKEAKKEEKKEEKKAGPDNQTLLRLLEQGEQLHSMFRCARIQGLETAEGLLLFGRDHFYVVDGFTLLKTKEIRDLDFLSQEMHDPIVPYPATGATQPPKSSRLCSKFSYNMIREVHKRRYLLQPIALEVFSSDGRNYLLAFPKKIRDRVFDKLTSMAINLSSGGSDSLGGQKANVAIETTGRGASLLSSLIGQQSVTQRWLSGNISNFQYLMHLNTLAGRCYNDLSQYPIFPWVLADYTSSQLDFNNISTFRDFSKPMGAQSPDRLEQFLKRFREWDDPSGETPPYMYGTHYSSAMIVVSYLVRLEPFTQQFLSLQGGHFDLADRMFHSVGDAWTSASRNNMADVKELIPEFFTLPEMFTNTNHFDLGVKQNGIHVNDVLLPAWCHGDPREFIRLHRQALESDYVSSHLHEWIDLIFGYKQNGEEAVKNSNLFHHLFYEGSVDFERIDDPLTRNATIGFVNNFGQIPTQLFKKPHPQKKVNILEGFSNTPGVTTSRLFYHAIHNMSAPQTPFKELRSAIGSIHQNDKIGVVALEQNKVFIGTNRYITWGLPDRSVRMGQIDNDKSVCVHEMCEVDEMTCAAAGDETTLFCGNTSGCITVWKVNNKPLSMKKLSVLNGHSDAITCLVSCQSHAVLVSASRDLTVLVWHLSEMFLIRQLPKHPHAVLAVAVNDATGDIATACSTLLHVWTLNGELLAVLNTCDVAPAIDPQQMIISLAFSTMNEWDNDNVIMCGTSDGIVKIYSCVVFENDGSVSEHPALENPNSNSNENHDRSAAIAARLEKQRKRLKNSSTTATSSSVSGSGSASLTSPGPASPSAGGSRATNIDVGGAQFVRVLVQRTALTMHTAFNRPDNVHPAPITAIAPSRDHRSLYVGDGIGRVWCWQSAEGGGRADHWVQDVTRQRCDDCEHKFTLADRKHHCRNCGQIFCSTCSRFESHITRMNISRPVRVCRKCFQRLQQSSNLHNL
ncbi:WD repeat and FYVE domain-containing protein 3 [Caenorhabditis elegans]|uniref:WD repeat and FYVE domain-containing protein 3 n=1 Tax=Caenorhabditis elegans TaxID=6239 RepID=H2FLM1_CAEEL|nr:WD repeat and FYVE domain-containing protein 3 [Caenorhabditis elegans]CCF23439.1 WD repeat and FYVE domain-containing protein 3 [Caenorhabditis elegans]|eukprot:NP_001255659.1 WD40 and FYVE domain protein [Caenorhabditis elegans]